jgi:hypothetical protein
MGNTIAINASDDVFVRTQNIGGVINRFGTFGNYNIDDKPVDLFTPDTDPFYSLIYNKTNIAENVDEGNINTIGINNSFGVYYEDAENVDYSYFNNRASDVENTILPREPISYIENADNSQFDITFKGNANDKIHITNTYTFVFNEKRIKIKTLITNKTSGIIHNVRYMFAINPEVSGSTSDLVTVNTIGNQYYDDLKNSIVYSKSDNSNTGIILYSRDEKVRVAFGETADTNPIVINNFNDAPTGNWRYNSLQVSEQENEINSSIYLMYEYSNTIENDSSVEFSYYIEFFNGDYPFLFNTTLDAFALNNHIGFAINKAGGTFGAYSNEFCEKMAFGAQTNEGDIPGILYNNTNILEQQNTIDVLKDDLYNAFLFSYNQGINEYDLINSRGLGPESQGFTNTNIENNYGEGTHTINWYGAHNDINITNSYLLQPNSKKIIITTTIHNSGPNAITNGRFAFVLNPCLDINGNEKKTTNKIATQSDPDERSIVLAQDRDEYGIKLYSNDANMIAAFSNSDDLNNGLTITDLRNDTPEGNWRYNNYQEKNSIKTNNGCIYLTFNDIELVQNENDTVSFEYYIEFYYNSTPYTNVDDEYFISTNQLALSINKFGSFGNYEYNNSGITLGVQNMSGDSGYFSLVYNSDLVTNILNESASSSNIDVININNYNGFHVAFTYTNSEEITNDVFYSNSRNNDYDDNDLDRNVSMTYMEETNSTYSKYKTATWEGEDGASLIRVNNQYILNTNSTKIKIITQIKNISAYTLSNVKFAYAISPYLFKGDGNTTNTIRKQYNPTTFGDQKNMSIVSAQYDLGLGMVLYSKEDSKVAYKMVEDETDYINSLDGSFWRYEGEYILDAGNNNTTDGFIYIMFNKGNLTPDSTQTFIYYIDFYNDNYAADEAFVIGKHLAFTVNNFGTLGNYGVNYNNEMFAKNLCNNNYSLIYNQYKNCTSDYNNNIDLIRPNENYNSFILYYKYTNDEDEVIERTKINSSARGHNYNDMLPNINLIISSDNYNKEIQWTSAPTDDGIQLRQTYNFSDNDRKIKVTTLISNFSGNVLTDVNFSYAINPYLSLSSTDTNESNKTIVKQYTLSNVDNRPIVYAKHSNSNFGLSLVAVSDKTYIRSAFGTNDSENKITDIINTPTDEPNGSNRWAEPQEKGTIQSNINSAIYLLYKSTNLAVDDSLTIEYYIEPFRNTYYEYYNTSDEIFLKNNNVGLCINQYGTFGNLGLINGGINISSIYSSEGEYIGLIYNTSDIDNSETNQEIIPYNGINNIGFALNFEEIIESVSEISQVYSNVGVSSYDHCFTINRVLTIVDINSDLIAEWYGQTYDNKVEIHNTYKLCGDNSRIDIETTIRNISNTLKSNFKYVFGINPNLRNNEDEINNINIIKKQETSLKCVSAQYDNDIGILLWNNDSNDVVGINNSNYGYIDIADNDVWLYSDPQSVDTTTENQANLYLMNYTMDTLINTANYELKYNLNLYNGLDYFTTQNTAKEKYLINDYIGAVINKYGTFGNMKLEYNESILRGPNDQYKYCIVYNASDIYDYTTSVDIIYPETKLNLFSISYVNIDNQNGISYYNTRDFYEEDEDEGEGEGEGEGANLIQKISLEHTSLNVVEWIGLTPDENLTVKLIYTLLENSKKINVKVELTNNTGNEMTDVRYLFGFDPDLGNSNLDEEPFLTTNIIRKQYSESNKSVVTAQLESNTGVILYSTNADSGVAFGTEDDNNGGFNVNNILESVPDGNWRMSNLQEEGTEQTDDKSIYIMYNVDSLESEGKTEFEYNIQLYNGEYSDALLDVVCFLRGSKILCADGSYVNIEDLTTAHIIKTNGAGGQKKVHSLARGRILHNNSKRDKNMLYVYKADKFNLIEDLVITGNHSVLIDNLSKEERGAIVNDMGRVFVTGNKYRLPAYLDNRNSLYDINGDYEIWHLSLENTDPKMNYGIWANGLLVETCSIYHLEKKLQNMKII